MTRGTLNLLLLGLSALATAAAVLSTTSTGGTTPNVSNSVETANSTSGTIRDARDELVAVRPYQRVVSLNTVADRLLLELLEPERLIAVTGYSARTHPEGWRYGTRSVIDDASDLEGILALNPDLVVISPFSDVSLVSRLTEAGVQVMDIGEVRGVKTTIASIRFLAAALGQKARGEQLITQFEQRLAALMTQHQRISSKLEGIYLAYYGNAFFGGTAGSSYADVLAYAGVDDLAQKFGYRDWPRYDPADLLKMNPKLIITKRGMAQVICAHSALGAVAACGAAGRVIELQSEYQSDPGLGVAAAALELWRLAYATEAESTL